MCLSSQGNLQSLFGSFKQINVAARRKQVLMTQKCNTFLWASWLEVCTLSTVLPHNDKDGRYCLGPSGRVCMMFPCQETQHWNISLTVLSCLRWVYHVITPVAGRVTCDVDHGLTLTVTDWWWRASLPESAHWGLASLRTASTTTTSRH